MTATDDLLEHNARYAAGYAAGASATPSRAIAVVACMDARVDVSALLGLRPGEAHVIRNAGGVVTDDVIRSLAVSQRVVGTREVMLVHHTDCGMLRLTEDGFRGQLEAEVGMRPPWAVEAFTDLAADVRMSMARVSRNPFLTGTVSVRGFVFDVATGRLEEISPS